MFLNTGSGGIDIFEVKLTFAMLTVRGQQHSFSTHERGLLWKCQSFWDRKCLDLRGTRTPNLRIHAECCNLSSYQGQTFAVPNRERCHTQLKNEIMNGNQGDHVTLVWTWRQSKQRLGFCHTFHQFIQHHDADALHRRTLRNPDVTLLIQAGWYGLLGF